ncbi:MAG: acyl-CoA reductase [Pseudomonadota bacterium]
MTRSARKLQEASQSAGLNAVDSVAADPLEVDRLLQEPPYGLPEDQRQARLLTAMNEAFGYHAAHCPAYARFVAKRGFSPQHRFTDLAEFPFLPAQAFKENPQMLRSVAAEDIRTTLSSSATSGIPSTIGVDKVTAKRQVRALSNVISQALGPKRRPVLVFDVSPEKDGGGGLGARGAAVRGFLNLASDVQYLMEPAPGGTLRLNEDAMESALAGQSEPVLVFGFTFVLYAYAIAPLLAAGKTFALPKGSAVAHIGGWKKLVDQQVSVERFNADAHKALGIAPTRVIDFYGFTEQMGVTYPTGPSGDKHCPAFAEVIVRDPATLEPVPDGEQGLLQFLTPLPHSYPGIAVLTDDVGVITGRSDAAQAWGGTRFKVLGRAKKAEARGCGDIMGDKIAAPKAALKNVTLVDLDSDESGAHLLLDHAQNHASGRLLDPLKLSALPSAGNLSQVIAGLRERRSVLDSYSSDELISLIGAVAQRWAAPDNELALLRQQGLSFLTSWCSPTALRRLADLSLRGRRGHLDQFMPYGRSRREYLRAVPRGVVGHWLSGNVPLLGMLALVQAIICRNANLLKVSSTHSRVMPALLDALRDLEVRAPSGKVLYGNDILATIVVVYFDRDDAVAAAQLSQGVDVRLAWGGSDAVASIMNLPKRFGTEDIVFGPKLSYSVIGRERLANERLAKRAARGAASDASVFDQYACASTHNVFVEAGGAAFSPEGFAELLAEEMDKAARRIPKEPADPATAAVIESARLRQELVGDVLRSDDTTWSVFFNESSPAQLPPPIYSRVVSVHATEDALACADYASKDIQTIGLGLDGPRRLEFANRAALRGAERFPDLGRMTFFQSPWDGLFPMERLVRWVTLGGPF